MLRAAPVIEAMRWEHASNAKKLLLVSMAELIEDITSDPSLPMRETISMLTDKLTEVIFAPQPRLGILEVPGPAMTVSMADEMLDVPWLSGNEVCKCVSLSGALWTTPLDVSKFKSLITGILSHVHVVSLFTFSSTVPIIVKLKQVCKDDGVQLDDTDDISCLTRLTIGTTVSTEANYFLREAVFIEHYLSMYKGKHSIFIKCLHDACDLVIAMAADHDVRFLVSVFVACACVFVCVCACLLFWDTLALLISLSLEPLPGVFGCSDSKAYAWQTLSEQKTFSRFSKSALAGRIGGTS